MLYYFLHLLVLQQTILISMNLRNPTTFTKRWCRPSAKTNLGGISGAARRSWSFSRKKTSWREWARIERRSFTRWFTPALWETRLSTLLTNQGPILTLSTNQISTLTMCTRAWWSPLVKKRRWGISRGTSRCWRLSHQEEYENVTLQRKAKMRKRNCTKECTSVFCSINNLLMCSSSLTS